MITFVNECVGCPPEMGCLGSTCPNRNVALVNCDACGDSLDSTDKMYVDGDKHYCLDCALKFLDKEVDITELDSNDLDAMLAEVGLERISVEEAVRRAGDD